MSEYEYGLAKDVIVDGSNNQTETQGQQGGQEQQQKQGNQSSGPLEKIGETITGAK